MGGIDIWSNLVFIHDLVVLKKLRILSIDTWGENPFFRPLLVQAKFPAVDCESLTPTRGATQQSVGVQKKKGKRVGGKMAFSGIPNKGVQKCSQTKGNKIRSGCLTPTFSGAQKRAEVLRHPCILGRPLKKGRETKVDRAGLPEKNPIVGALMAVLKKKIGPKGPPCLTRPVEKSPSKRGTRSEVANKWPKSSKA